MASRKLVVEIVGDSRQLDRTFAKSSRNAKKFEGTMTTALGGGGGLKSLASRNAYGAAALAATAGFVKTTQAASDLNEEITKSQSIFGSAAGTVETWSKGTSESLKINQTEALRAAGAYGQMFRVIGFGQTEAAEMSQRMVGLAADMASFNNADPTDMLDRLRSGLAGEAEPLRQFGVFLSEAAVKQEAVRLGLVRVGGALTEAQKVQARYSLILAQTTIAQGDVARTGGNLAGQQRELNAKFQELSTSIGVVLLPAMTGIITTANDVIGALGSLGGAVAALDGLKIDIGIDLHVNLKGAAANALFALVPGSRQLADAVGALQDRNQPDRSRPPLVVGESAADKVPRRPTPPAPPKTPPRGDPTSIPFREYQLAVAEHTERLSDDIAATKKIISVLTGRLAGAKTLKDRKALLESINRYAGHLESLNAQVAGASAAIRDANAEQARLAAELRATAQFAALGFGPGGAELVPGLPALKKVFARISEAMKSATPKLKSQTKKLMEAIRKILAGGMGEVSEEVRRKLQQLLHELDLKLGGGTKTRQQHFRKTNVEAILRSAGLTPEQIRLVSGRLAGTTGGRAPVGGQAAFGTRVGAGATVVNIGTVVTNDPDRFLRDMQKKASRTRAQQRGVRPGVALGGA